MANTEIIKENKKVRAELKDYAYELLHIRKGELKLSISNLETLNDILEDLFKMRISNKAEGIEVLTPKTRTYQSQIRIQAYGKVWDVFSNVSDYKIRQQLG